MRNGMAVLRMAGVRAAAVFFACAAIVGARELLFLGLTDASGEPAHQHLEQFLRNEFAGNFAFRLVGGVETERIVREIERQGRKRTEPFVPQSARLPDTAVVARVVVEDYAMGIVRRRLAWGGVDARITVRLYLSEAAGPASYNGQFSAAASKMKGFLGFADAQKTVHISAVDRSELQSEMYAKLVKEISAFTAQWTGALASGPVHKKQAATDSTETPPPEPAQEETEEAQVQEE